MSWRDLKVTKGFQLTSIRRVPYYWSEYRKMNSKNISDPIVMLISSSETVPLSHTFSYFFLFVSPAQEMQIGLSQAKKSGQWRESV